MTQSKAKPSAPQGIKIRTNYVPKVKSNRGKPPSQICPRCNQPVPVSEMGEHVRIELLDPRWKEQKDKARERNLGSNLDSNLVSTNLKLLAKTRPDIFVGGDELEVEKTLKEQEKGKVIWDGHTASIGTVTQKLGQSGNREEQLAELRRDAEEAEARRTAIGPKVPNQASQQRPAGLPPVPPAPSMQHAPQPPFQGYHQPPAGAYPPQQSGYAPEDSYADPYYGGGGGGYGGGNYDPYAGQYGHKQDWQGGYAAYPPANAYPGYPPAGGPPPLQHTGMKRPGSPDGGNAAKRHK